MQEDQDKNKQKQTPQGNKRTVTSSFKCKFCGKMQEITVEIPETANTPTMIWDD